MKSSLRFLSHIIPLLGLSCLWLFSDISISVSPLFAISYFLCFLICPILARRSFGRVGKAILFAISLLSLVFGVPALEKISGPFGAMGALLLGMLCFIPLSISFVLPEKGPCTSLLTLRGVKEKKAEKFSQLRASYAFFFKQSGLYMGIFLVFQLYIQKTASLSALWSSALVVFLASFVGLALYHALGAPCEKPVCKEPKKSRSIWIFVLSFLLLLICVYLYVGYLYTTPEAALLKALSAVQSILTPALFATGIGFASGIFVGWIFSLCGARFFQAVLHGLFLIPVAIWCAVLYHFVPCIPICLLIPLLLYCAKIMVMGKVAVLSYRRQPIATRKKTIYGPLLHKANLASLPSALCTGVFSSVWLDLLYTHNIARLSELSRIFAVSILGSILCLLSVFWYVTKEVRHHA